MKHTEKLDLVLKALYEEPEQRGEIVELLRKRQVDVTLDEAQILGRRLDKEGFVKYTPTRDSALVDLKSEGIEFVEGDSFAHRGHSVVNNNYISNSPNANLINQSSGVNISQQNQSEIEQTLGRIKEAINADNSVDSSKRQEVLECVQEIEHGVNTGRSPKFALKSLDLPQKTGQSFKQHFEVAHYNSRKGKDSPATNASVGDCTKFQYIQRLPV